VRVVGDDGHGMVARGREEGAALYKRRTESNQTKKLILKIWSSQKSFHGCRYGEETRRDSTDCYPVLIMRSSEHCIAAEY